MPGIDRTDGQNERFESQATSCTLKPRVYSFRCRDIEFNIIDVPGLADTGGIHQDQINKKAIIREVGRFTEIHGICIVVSASTPKLTIEFTFCLNEILSSLNKSSIRNIMFVVTNSAGYGYNGGLVADPLSEYINKLNKDRDLSLQFKSNVFFIDNECFRFLVGWSQSEKFREAHQDMINRYEESWKKSRAAIFSLLRKMYTMNAHKTEETMSVARAGTVIRCIIPSLTCAMGRIAVASTDEYKKTVMSSLINDGTLEKPDVEVRDKNQPQLVCIHKSCLKQSIDPKTKNPYFDFSHPCHKDCFIRGVTEAKPGDPALEQCQKIDLEGNCRSCKHNFKSHMHVPYRVTKTTTKVNTGASKPLTHKEAEDRYQDFIKSVEKERDTIIRETIVLAAFLQKHAIIEYNTIFEERLEYEIRTEEANSNKEAVKNLRKTIDDYKLQIDLMKSAQDDKERNVEVADVEKSLKTLFSLPLYGNTIQHLYENELPASEAADPKDFIRCKVKYIPD